MKWNLRQHEAAQTLANRGSNWWFFVPGGDRASPSRHVRETDRDGVHGFGARQKTALHLRWPMTANEIPDGPDRYVSVRGGLGSNELIAPSLIG